MERIFTSSGTLTIIDNEDDTIISLRATQTDLEY